MKKLYATEIRFSEGKRRRRLKRENLARVRRALNEAYSRYDHETHTQALIQRYLS